MSRYVPVFAAAALVFTLLNEPFSVTLPMLFAILIHEAAHFLVVLLCGGRLRAAKTSVLGISFQYDATALSYSQELFVALAGAAANFLSAFLVRWLFPASFPFVFFSMMLGVLNLLPIRSLDGGDALYAIVASCASPQVAERTVKIVSAMFSVLLFILAAYLQIALRGNLSLFCLSILLFFRVFREDLT